MWICILFSEKITVELLDCPSSKSKCISLPQLFLHSHIFSGMQGLDFRLSGLLYSFNLHWSRGCCWNERWTVGCVKAAPAEPDWVRVYLEVSGRWCDCSPTIQYAVMDACAPFSVPAASRALIFKTKKEVISGEVWHVLRILSEKKQKYLADPWWSFGISSTVILCLMIYCSDEVCFIFSENASLQLMMDRSALCQW